MNRRTLAALIAAGTAVVAVVTAGALLVRRYSIDFGDPFDWEDSPEDN